MASDLSGVALVTGGGRGIGANVARELHKAGMRVAVAARTPEQVEQVGDAVGTGCFVDVTDRSDVKRMVGEVEHELGAIDLLVANAGIDIDESAAWEVDIEEWWRVFEVNVLGVYLCCRAVIPSMLARGGGRIVLTSSGSSYLPRPRTTAYPASKAAVSRFGEALANQLRGRIPVFHISPGLVRTAMTEEKFSDDAPWTPPECAPRLVRALASGRYDSLAGRYLHAEHDTDLDELLVRAEQDDDLNMIRLRR